MRLKVILEKLNMLDVYEIRRATDEYVELVFYNEKQKDIDNTLNEMLGPPRKPAGVAPSQDDLGLTEEYGGIWDNQTLFVNECEGNTVMAMYWPWDDEVHTTLRMARLRK
jgi:hypothetical protein